MYKKMKSCQPCRGLYNTEGREKQDNREIAPFLDVTKFNSKDFSSAVGVGIVRIQEGPNVYSIGKRGKPIYVRNIPEFLRYKTITGPTLQGGYMNVYKVAN